MFHCKVARGIAEIEELRPAWDSLPTAEQSLFQSYRWNRLAAEVFCGREEPYFVFVENDNGAAILPAVIDILSNTISFAGERLFDYRDYLARGDAGPLALAWQRLVGLNLPLSIGAICNPERAIWECFPKSFFSRAPRLISKGITVEDFVHRHRRAFGRLWRLERMGLRVQQYSGDSPIVRRIYERRSKQCADGELFRGPQRLEFMVAVCREEGSRCEVFALEHCSTLVAALITFRDGNFRRFYTTYYDRDWARFSPGVSLLFEVSRRSLEQGLSCDLMTGEQAYKVRIAQSAQDLFQVKAGAAELQKMFSGATASGRAA